MMVNKWVRFVLSPIKNEALAWDQCLYVINIMEDISEAERTVLLNIPQIEIDMIID